MAGSAFTAFKGARDALLDANGDYDTAVSTFEWPELGDRFNWAIDWFDAIARGNDATALWIVEEDGSAVGEGRESVGHGRRSLAGPPPAPTP